MKLGIDFGTSFSTPAVEYLGQKEILLPDGEYGIPSLFYYDHELGIRIGEEAEKYGVGVDAVNLKREVKMDLYSSFTADGRTFTSTEIVASILKDLVLTAKSRAKEQIRDDNIEGVVITVPATFKSDEKKKIIEAARLPEEKGGPGLKVLGLLKEPVAAALAYFKTSLVDKTRVLVYDLGGGTCDVAIVEADSSSRDKYKVIDFGTERVGGKDWDNAICDYLIYQLEKITGKVIRNNTGYYEKVKREAISIKHGFSKKSVGGLNSSQRVSVEIDGAIHRFSIDRALFDEITSDLYRQTERLVKRIIQRNGSNRIEKIICVGGGSNMPQVQEGLRDCFGDKEIVVFEPERAVAYGAAYYANEMELADIASYSYGIRIHKRGEDENVYHISNIIKRGEKLPIKRKQNYLRRDPKAEYVSLFIYENDFVDDQILLDDSRDKSALKLRLKVPKDAPKDAKVEVEMCLDMDGILRIIGNDSFGNSIEGELQVLLLDE